MVRFGVRKVRGLAGGKDRRKRAKGKDEGGVGKRPRLFGAWG